MSNAIGIQNVGYTGALVSFILENKRYPIQDKIILAGALTLLPLSKISTAINNPKVFNSIGVPIVGLMAGLSIGAIPLKKSVNLDKQRIKELTQRFVNIQSIAMSISNLAVMIDTEFWANYTKKITGVYKEHSALSNYNAARITGLTFIGSFLISLGAGLLATFLRYHKQSGNKSKLKSLKQFFAELKKSHVYSTIIEVATYLAIFFFMPAIATEFSKSSMYNKFTKSKLGKIIQDTINSISRALGAPMINVLFNPLPVIYKNSRFVVMNGTKDDINDDLQQLADRLNDVIPEKYKTSAILKNIDGVAPASVRFPLSGSIILFDMDLLKSKHLTDDEILAIMLHEYGHIYHLDSVTLASIMYIHVLLSAFSEKITTHLALVGSLGLFSYHLGYEAELKADKFCVEIGYGDELASALRKLTSSSRAKYKSLLEVDVHGSPETRIKKLETLGKQFLKK